MKFCVKNGYDVIILIARTLPTDPQYVASQRKMFKDNITVHIILEKLTLSVKILTVKDIILFKAPMRQK